METSELFRTAAFLLFIAWWIFAGIRRKEHILSWVASGGVIILCVISGSELENFILSSLQIPVHHVGFGGAFIFGFTGFLILKRVLAWKQDVGAVIASAFFACSIIIFSCCLIEGCCFGRMTQLPLQISYAPGSPAHNWQSSCGLISFNDGNTHALHPVQLYRMLSAIICFIVFLALRVNSRIKSRQMVSLVLSLFLILQFLVSSLAQPVSAQEESFNTIMQVLTVAGSFSFVVIGLVKWKDCRQRNLAGTKSIVVVFCLGASGVMFFSHWTDLIVIVTVQASLLIVIVAEKIRQQKRTTIRNEDKRYNLPASEFDIPL